MSEQNEPSPSQDEVLEFLNDFNAICPVCRQNNWGLFPTEAPFAIPLFNQEGLRMELKGLKVYGVLCLNCGLIRTHSTEIVNQRISEEPSHGDG